MNYIYTSGHVSEGTGLDLCGQDLQDSGLTCSKQCLLTIVIGMSILAVSL